MNRSAIWLIPAWVFLFILPFTHTVALRLLSLFAAFGIAVWLRWKDGAPQLVQLPAWRWIALWAALPVLLSPLSRDAAYSLREFKSEVLYGMLALCTFFVLVRSEQAMRMTLRVLIAGYAVLTLWAIGGRLHAGEWIEASYFGGTGTFSTYLVTAAPLLVLAWRLRLLGARTSWLVALLVTLGLCAGLLTEQRSFWLALGLQVAALLVLLRAARVWRPSPALFWGGLAAVAALSCWLLLEAVARRYGPGTDLVSLFSQDPRARNWGQVMAWIAERPLGYGFGRGMMAKAFPEMWGRPDMFWHAHNLVLNFGFQLGVPGMLAVLGMFGGLLAFWLQLLRDGDPALRAAGIAGALVVLGVFARNMTNDFFQRDQALLFWALNGALAGYVQSLRGRS